MSGQHLLTAAEVAQKLRVKPATIVRLCQQGRIPATKPLGTWLIEEAWIEQAIREGFNQGQVAS